MWLVFVQVTLIIGAVTIGTVSANFTFKAVYVDNISLIIDANGTARLPLNGKLRRQLDLNDSELLSCLNQNYRTDETKNRIMEIFFTSEGDYEFPRNLMPATLVIYRSHIGNNSRVHDTPVSTEAQACDNLSSGKVVCNYSRTVTYKKSVTIKSSLTLDVGAEVTAEFELACIAKKSTKVAVKYPFMHASEETHEETETFTMSGQVEPKPNTTNALYLTDQRAKVDFDVVYDVGVEGHIIVGYEREVDGRYRHTKSADDILKNCPKTKIQKEWKQSVSFETTTGVDVELRQTD